MKIRFTSALLAAMFAAASVPAMGQGFYDDDIYDASKPVVKPAKTEKAKPAKQQSTQQVETFPSLSGTGYYYGGDGNIYPEYKAAGSYNYDSGNTRSVDEYNRRGIFAYSTADSVAQDSLGDSFAYTRRLERFHNPDLVSGSADETLKEYYYSENTAPTTSINVYVVDGWPYYSNPYRYGYFGPSWSFTWGYRPWLSWGWGYYDPYWAWASPGWGWNWGWNWGWGPGWGPAWGPGWGGPAWAGPIYGGNWRRPSGIGSSMTHGRGYAGAGRVSGSRPAAGVGSRPGSFNNHGVSAGARPGTAVGGTRPGANVRPGANAAGTNARPGYTPNSRPGSSSHYGVGSRPGAGTQHQQPNYNSNNNSNRNTGNYSRPSSGGGSRGGFSGGGSRGGGSRSGGGGGRGSRR